MKRAFSSKFGSWLAKSTNTFAAESHPSGYCNNVCKRFISSSQLTVEKQTDSSRFEKRPAKENLLFGTTMSDHMLMVEWTTQDGWAAPKIVPYQNLSLSPAASCLHYGTLIFVSGSLKFCKLQMSYIDSIPFVTTKKRPPML